MKNFLSLIAVLFLSVVVAGCGAKVPEEAPPAEATGEDVVESQLEDAGVSDADYEAELKKSMQEQPE